MTRALLGGSFDPVHAGHVAMAAHVLERGWADVVHVVPAWLSPHKDLAAAPAAARLDMVRLAFAGLPRIVVDPREIAAGRPCRTVETLESLVADHPGDPFRLVIGADNLADFHRWSRPDRLLELAQLVVLGREGWPLDDAAVAASGLPRRRVLLAPEFVRPVSSTAVRAMLAAESRSLADLVAGGLPAPVARHIIDHGLYRPDPNGEHRVPDPD